MRGTRVTSRDQARARARTRVRVPLRAVARGARRMLRPRAAAPSAGQMARRRVAVASPSGCCRSWRVGLLLGIAVWPEIDRMEDRARVSFRRVIQAQPDAVRLVEPATRARRTEPPLHRHRRRRGADGCARHRGPDRAARRHPADRRRLGAAGIAARAASTRRATGSTSPATSRSGRTTATMLVTASGRGLTARRRRVGRQPGCRAGPLRHADQRGLPPDRARPGGGLHRPARAVLEGGPVTARRRPAARRCLLLAAPAARRPGHRPQPGRPGRGHRRPTASSGARPTRSSSPAAMRARCAAASPWKPTG